MLAARALRNSLPPVFWRSLGAMKPGAWPYTVVAFHRIADLPRDELSYPPSAFARLCRYWRDHYQVLSLEGLLRRLESQTPADAPCLTITFDDGYADNARVAAPILDHLGLQATFFVTTGALGSPSRFPWDAPSAPAMMTWTEVRLLHRAGFGIGSHTVSHSRLAQLAAPQLELELQASRRRLEDELGSPVLDFAYPFGGKADCTPAQRDAVRRSGYRCCLSCHGGSIAPGDSPYDLHRLCISPRYHASLQDWARAYLRLCWQPPASPLPHW